MGVSGGTGTILHYFGRLYAPSTVFFKSTGVFETKWLVKKDSFCVALGR